MLGPTKWDKWLRAREREQLGKTERRYERPGDEPLPRLAACTGQDWRALAAIAMCWQLYAAGDYNAERAALDAIRSLLRGMQTQCWPFARELVAWAMDWTDRDRMWDLVRPRDFADALGELAAFQNAERKARGDQ